MYDIRLEINARELIILDADSEDVVETFPLPLVSRPAAFVSRDPANSYNNVVQWTVTQNSARRDDAAKRDGTNSQRTGAEFHLFQCIDKPVSLASLCGSKKCNL